MQSQPRKSGRPLAIDPGCGEAVLGDSKYSSRVPGMEVRDSAPNIGGKTAVVDKERVIAGSTNEKV